MKHSIIEAAKHIKTLESHREALAIEIGKVADESLLKAHKALEDAFENAICEEAKHLTVLLEQKSPHS